MSEETTQSNTIQGIEIETRGLFLYLKNEKKRKRDIILESNSIKSTPIREVVETVISLRKELGERLISKCSYQLLCALVSKHFNEPKKKYTDYHTGRIKLKYTRKIIELTKAVYILSLELKV